MSSSAGLGPLLLLLAGTSARFRLIFLEDDGSPIDLTTVSELSFVLKRDAYIDDQYAVVTKMLDDFDIADPANGYAEFDIDADETEDAEQWGDYFYYAKLKLASGRAVIPDLMRGPAKLDRNYDGVQAVSGSCIVRLDAPSGVTPDFSSSQIFTVSITPGAESVSVVFPIPYSPSAPSTVIPTLIASAGVGAFTYSLRDGSITTTGCVIDLGAPAPAGCKLRLTVIP